MLKNYRGIRLATLLAVVAACAIIFGLGVHVYRALSPVRRWARLSKPGNPQQTRIEAILNLTYDVPQSEREEAFPVLLAAAKDADPFVRAQVTAALRGRPDHFAEVLSTLRTLMKDPDAWVRTAAILNLETFVKPGTAEVSAILPDLLDALEDPKPAVRLEACRALHVFRHLNAEAKRVVPVLVRLIQEEEGTHRQIALHYLITMQTVPRDLEPTLRACSKSRIPADVSWCARH